MTILELKELIRPLSEEDKLELKRMLDEPREDHPIFHIGEIVSQLPDAPQPPSDFAKNFRQYLHEQKIAHE